LKYNTFIFDFDYTLADSTVGIVECVNYALAAMGLEPKDRECIRKTIGMTLGNMLFSLTGVSDEHSSKRFFNLFLEKADEVMTDSTILFPDTVSVLSKLKQSGCKTGIVTTKVRYRVEEILAKFDIVSLIDYVVGLEDVTAPKPSPEGLLKAASHFGVDKASVLFIGDSLIDANTANNSAIDFAAVLSGTTTEQDFKNLPHVLIAKNLTEILETFLESS